MHINDALNITIDLYPILAQMKENAGINIMFRIGSKATQFLLCSKENPYLYIKRSVAKVVNI
jgi:hypothetical protein